MNKRQRKKRDKKQLEKGIGGFRLVSNKYIKTHVHKTAKPVLMSLDKWNEEEE